MYEPAPCGTTQDTEVEVMYEVVWQAVRPTIAVWDNPARPKLVPCKVTVVPAVAGLLLRSTMVMDGESYENRAKPVPTTGPSVMAKPTPIPVPGTLRH